MSSAFYYALFLYQYVFSLMSKFRLLLRKTCLKSGFLQVGDKLHGQVHWRSQDFVLRGPENRGAVGADSPQYEAPQVTEYGIEVMNFLTTRTCVK